MPTPGEQWESDISDFIELLVAALEIDEVADLVTTVVLERTQARRKAWESQAAIPLTDSPRVRRPVAPISGRGQLKGRKPR